MTDSIQTLTEDRTATIRPQDDLFLAVNGQWLADTAIPEDQPVYGAFNELRDAAELACRAIVEEAAARTDLEPGQPEQLIGDLYRSFLDSDRVAAAGATPIAGQLAAIDALDSVPGLVRLLGALRRDGVSGALGLAVSTDADQPDSTIAYLYQGGIGLPDESFYREDHYAPIREQYAAHVRRMLELAAIADPAGTATTAIALETELAAAHWDRVRCRDRSQTHNPTDRPALDAALSAELVQAWLDGLQAPAGLFEKTEVMQPSFLTALAGLLVPARLADWQAWLRWRVVHTAAPYLPDDFVDESFAFYGRVLSGTPTIRARWKRGVALVEGAVGEALGALYVDRHFDSSAKQQMDVLVANLIEAYRRSITGLSWMTEPTRARALEKLERFTPKIGYPVRFRDYQGLHIDPADLIGNVRRSEAAELDRDLAKVGQPVDRDEWFMTPQTVNAYYNPGMNEIVFPAAILQPPYFDPDADAATNYGGIGAVIGHEIGHGFDDQGSKYDGSGALIDWWTPQDREAFEELTQALITQYSALSPDGADGRMVNGALTVGENIGDLGGLGIAYQAWLVSLDGRDPAIEEIRELFSNWARAWRSKGRPEEVQRRLAIDPHSPPEFRANQVVRNLDEFYRAFEVTASDALWLDPAGRVRIW